MDQVAGDIPIISVRASGLRDEMDPSRIGYRMKLLRVAAGMRPSEVADMLGIERTYWSRHENGRRSISLEVAALLVDRFGVTLDFIYLGHWAGVPFDLAQKMRRVEAEFATSTDETSLRGKSSSPIRV